MRKTKKEWIDLFRAEAEKNLPVALKQPNQNKKSDVINKAIKQYLSDLLTKIKYVAKKD